MVVRISVDQDVLRGNQDWAQRNRSSFKQNAVWTVNLMSSPGAGKTSVLENVIPILKDHLRLGVIEGDVMTTLDAERIASLGVKTVQINTRGACHLDAKMINETIQSLPLSQIDLLIIENVGNLVCPADFDLGEDHRITMLSVTEGADKVEKYPAVFQRADAILLNKVDLLPYLTFDVLRFKDEVDKVNPNAPVFQMSATSGEGLKLWTEWLVQVVKNRRTGSEKGFM